MHTLEEQLQRLLDRAAIIDVVVAFANSFDAQDWSQLRSVLAGELATDYSQFRGAAPTRMHADAYVEARCAGLAGLRTLHISTNHRVRIDRDTAECVSAYQIYRLDPQGVPGANRLDTAGMYEHSLVRTDSGWRICGIRQTVVLQEGNSAVHGAFRPENTATGGPPR